MELKEFLHMKQGDGELSYAQNALLQRAAARRTKRTIERAIHSLLSDVIMGPNEALKVADLGCGVGPVPLAFASTVIKAVQNTCKELKKNGDGNCSEVEVPQIQIHFNDLPCNDFNSLFRDLAKNSIQNALVMGVPGSFYAQLFAPNSLHFVHSNYALHWLSQVPPGLHNEQGMPINKGNIHISETTPLPVAKAYLAQFQQDWSVFLNCRSLEVVPKGRVLLVVRGRPSMACHQPVWELKLLAHAIASLVSQGLIKEEKLDSFEFPCYLPMKEEIEEVVQREGSFEIEQMETVIDHIAQEIEDKRERAETIAKCVRGFTESVVLNHFGEEVLDALYNKLTQVTFKHLASSQPLELCSIIFLLRRR